jgi:hypothetical protein
MGGKAKAGEDAGKLVDEGGATVLDAGAPEDRPEGWNAEEEHTTAVDRMFAMPGELELSRDEMVFDVRDFLLDTIKARPKPWSATSQAEQRDVAAACEHAGRELVRKIVEAVASNGVDSIRVLLTKVNAGGEDIVLTGKVKFIDADPAEKDRAILSLHHAIGKFVMLTRASAEDYAGGDREAETDADEPDLNFEASTEDDD